MTTTTTSSSQIRHQHGVNGVWYGGEWLDIEECDGKFTNVEKLSSCSTCDHHDVCPRGRTRHTSVKSTSPTTGIEIYDIVIIGAGCIGAAIARELSKYQNVDNTPLSILWIEAADDVSQGATKGNSGIVHAGYDDKPGTNRAKYCWKGNQMFASLDKELRFGYQKNGSLVIALNEIEVEELHNLKKRGDVNGVQNLRIINKDELFQMEPYINKNAIAALYSPDAGNVIPYEYCVALAENACDNGVELRIRTVVTAIEQNNTNNNNAIAQQQQNENGHANGHANGHQNGHQNGYQNGYQNGHTTHHNGNIHNGSTVNGHSNDQDGINFTLKLRQWEPPEYIHETNKYCQSKKYNLGMIVLGAGIFGHFCATRASLIRQSSSSYFDSKYHIIGFVGLYLFHQFKHNDVFSKWFGRNGSRRDDTFVNKKGTLLNLVEKSGKPIGKLSDTLRPAIVSIKDMLYGGSGSATALDGQTVQEYNVMARNVINCAGGAADKVANLINDFSFKIKPRVGDYLLLEKNQGYLTERTIFPCPDPVLGKGVLVQTTLWGNLILGPTARDMHEEQAAQMSPEEIQTYILSKCKELVPDFDPQMTFHAFAGARAKSDRGDWIIEPSNQNKHFINVAGIDSPGLAGSPAIALEVVNMLGKDGLNLIPNPNFKKDRAPIIFPKRGMKGLKMGKVGKYDSDGTNVDQMAANVICKCEKVTELEVVRAVHRSLPIDSSQAIRKRTRAGMGQCQAEYENYNCEARVRAIIARENNVPIEMVGKRPWPATSTLSKRWIDDWEREQLKNRMKPNANKNDYWFWQ